MRLQLERKDGTVVNVPQSLTSPAKPTSKPIARAQLETLGRAILDYPHKHRSNARGAADPVDARSVRRGAGSTSPHRAVEPDQS